MVTQFVQFLSDDRARDSLIEPDAAVEEEENESVWFCLTPLAASVGNHNLPGSKRLPGFTSCRRDRYSPDSTAIQTLQTTFVLVNILEIFLDDIGIIRRRMLAQNAEEIAGSGNLAIFLF